MKKGLIIAPSIMCADLYNLEKELNEMEQLGIELLHFDVMDGHFVPNIGLSIELFKAIKKNSPRFKLDIHLMVDDPDLYIPIFTAQQSEIITVHVEACKNIYRTVQLIKKNGSLAGVAINPMTPLSNIMYILEYIDLVLIMTVEPGFAGQKFIPAIVNKINDLKLIIEQKNLAVLIEVDGNINQQTIPKVIKAGANILVAGSSSLFRKNKSISEAYHQMLVQINGE